MQKLFCLSALALCSLAYAKRAEPVAPAQRNNRTHSNAARFAAGTRATARIAFVTQMLLADMFAPNPNDAREDALQIAAALERIERNLQQHADDISRQ